MSMYDLKVLNYVHDVILDTMTLKILKVNEESLLIIRFRICLIYCSSIGDSCYANRRRQEAEKILNTVKRKIFAFRITALIENRVGKNSFVIFH